MALEKLIIYAETNPHEFTDEIHVLFNPNQISFRKQVNWKKTPKKTSDTTRLQFTHGESATLSLDLFFDTYELREDVREYSNRIFYLATVERHGKLHRPPLCKLQWGRYDFENFVWILSGLTQRFSLFLNDGTPVRATLSCSFQQWRSDTEEARLLDLKSSDVAKFHIVRRGDTLSAIAAVEYQDPALWRPIAEANHLDDPRVLEIGCTLNIPALKRDS